MKVYSDTITRADVILACRMAEKVMGGRLYLDVDNGRAARGGGRVLDIKLTGDGSQTARKQNSGYSGASQEYSAGWASWGWMMAELFDIDPAARWGSPTRPTYDGKQDFMTKTDWVFDTDLDMTARTAASLPVRSGRARRTV